MTLYSGVVSQILGPALVADTGAWGTYGWSEHVLGAPGYRIAGGSDEIQRNIIGEHVLGLPPEPRATRTSPGGSLVLGCAWLGFRPAPPLRRRLTRPRSPTHYLRTSRVPCP